jgi:hypothetical protein
MQDLKEGQEERIRETVIKRIDQYLEERRDIGFMMAVSSSVDNERDHIVNIGTSILCTKWKVGYPGGSFVQALVNNDLMETHGRADDINLNCIRFYVYLMYNQGYIS